MTTHSPRRVNSRKHNLVGANFVVDIPVVTAIITKLILTPSSACRGFARKSSGAGDVSPHRGSRLSGRENDKQGRRMCAAQNFLRMESVAPKESPYLCFSVGRGGRSPIRFHISLFKTPSKPRSGSEAAILGSTVDSSFYRSPVLSRASCRFVHQPSETPRL
jgi:hypothetical protein